MYGSPPSRTTVTSNPEGLQVLVDGQAVMTPAAFLWLPGTQHAISAATQMNPAKTTRYVFARWSHDGPPEQTVIADPNTTLYIANMIPQYQVFSSAPADISSGSYTVAPFAADGFYSSQEELTLKATPSEGFQFYRWNPLVVEPAANPIRVKVNSGHNFRPVFSSKPLTRIQMTPDWLSGVVDSLTSPSYRSMRVDGSLTPVPQNFEWNAGSTHTVQAINFAAGVGIQGSFANWMDNAPAFRTIAAGAQGGIFTASFKARYYLNATPTIGGTITRIPDSPDGFYESGTAVTLSASGPFQGWNGDVTGTVNPQLVRMDGPKSVEAFIGAPVQPVITRIEPSSVAAGSPGLTLRVWGRFGVFTPAVVVSLNGNPHAYRLMPFGDLIEINLTPQDLAVPATIFLKITNVVFSATASLMIQPAPASCNVTAPGVNAVMDARGGAQTIRVEIATGCSWPDLTAPDWIEILPPPVTTGGGYLSYFVARNSSLTSRTGAIRVGTASVTVTQSGVSCPELQVDHSTVTLPFEHSTASVAFWTPIAECPWTASTDAEWIRFLNPASGIGSGKFQLEASANSGVRRAATLKINGLSVTVTQDAARPVLNAVLPAASYQTGAVAPGSFASLFGTDVAGALSVATQSPLPTTLSGIEVFIRDATGSERKAQLHFVSPEQINFLVPEGTAIGAATVTLRRDGQSSGSTSLKIEAVAPGVFTLSSSGGGTPNASITRVKASGQQEFDLVYECTAAGCAPKPIDLSLPGETVVLVLYCTGLRNARTVEAEVGGVPATVLFAGAQGSEGLDQVNVLLPRTLAGRGEVDVQITADGKPANPVWIRVLPEVSQAPVISWDFSQDRQGWVALAATTLLESGLLIVDPTGPDPRLLGPPIEVKAENYPFLKVRMSVACEGTGQIYFKTAANNTFSEERRVSFVPAACPLCPDAPLKVSSIRMDSHPQWTPGTTITTVRVDPCDKGFADTNKDIVKVDYIRMSPIP